jgi:hypothetical protein
MTFFKNLFINGNRKINDNINTFEKISMKIKPQPNHHLYLQTLQKMTPAQRLAKAFELSTMTKELFLEGLKKRFSEKTEIEIKKIYLERIAKCYNRNY